MTHEEEIKAHVRSLFTNQKLAVLATNSDGQPYTSLVAFVGRDDLKDIYFATPRTTRKYKNLKNEPRVALLINSSANKPSDFHQAIAVTATGAIMDIQDNQRASILKAYLARHPHLKDFIEAPTTALVRVRVRHYYLVKNFQKVMELHIK
jgi:nitroimidazol reductase NimA-like FMN-containing flavoprotein (pyridoxamine 5'-phosphate oxidase superfamily)